MFRVLILITVLAGLMVTAVFARNRNYTLAAYWRQVGENILASLPEGVAGIIAKWSWLAFLALAATGILPVLLTGGHMSGMVLLAHMAAAGVFLIAIFAWLPKFMPGSKTSKKAQDSPRNSITTWLLLALLVTSIAPILISMQPGTGTAGQALALDVHRYGSLLLFIAVLAYGMWAVNKVIAVSKSAKSLVDEKALGESSLENVNPDRLFLASCFALIATSVTFAVIGAIMGALKSDFILTNEEVGWIGGAALWGFTISIFVFGPFVDGLGMRRLVGLAFASHAAGALLLIAANGFAMAFAGALVLALGNGLVEAALNPLVATLYPTRKTEMLNKFHVWFPGGIVIGGVACYLMDQAAVGAWQLKVALILIPTAIYGYLFWGQRYPQTERVQSGVTFGEMWKATLLRPLFWVLFFCMMITASLELGPNRWIPAVMESVGIQGILVLVWINLIMAGMRYFAGPVVHKLEPLGILLASAILTGIGLFLLSYTGSLATAIAAGTVFALGVSYFWPTMLGVTSERVPKGGALALALIGGIGMAFTGLVTTPMMGRVADYYLHQNLPMHQTAVVLQDISRDLPALPDSLGLAQDELMQAAMVSKQALNKQTAGGLLPPKQTANALRTAIAAAPQTELAHRAQATLAPAENLGGQLSFRLIAPAALLLVLAFGALYWREQQQPERPDEPLI